MAHYGGISIFRFYPTSIILSNKFKFLSNNLSNWNVSNVKSMENMFSGCKYFNQDLSNWCVTNFTSAPLDFDSGATAWTLPKPVWGTCPE